MHPLRVIVLLANGGEEIESATAIDVLRRAELDVTVASVHPNTAQVTLSHNVTLIAETTLDQLQSSDYGAVVLPGGMDGANAFAHSEAVRNLLGRYESERKWIAAMCAAPMALKAAGVGKGKKATCYPSLREKIDGHFHYQNKPVVVDDKFITSQAPATAMLWALTIVEQLCGRRKAEEIAEGLCYKLT